MTSTIEEIRAFSAGLSNAMRESGSTQPLVIAAIAHACAMLNEYADLRERQVAEPAQQADSGRVGNADHSRDLRHLIYLDTQFNWRGETDLKLPEMQALEARGWITEGAENGEFEITDAGREAIEAALAAQGQAKVYQCPRCATAMQVDPTAKPAPPASPAGVPDEWKRALDAAHYYIDATDVELEEDRMTRADALRHARNLREALSQESQPNG